MLAALLLNLFISPVHADPMSAVELIKLNPAIGDLVKTTETAANLQCLAFMSSDPSLSINSSVQGVSSDGAPTLYQISIPCRPAGISMPFRILNIRYTMNGDKPEVASFELLIPKQP